MRAYFPILMAAALLGGCTLTWHVRPDVPALGLAKTIPAKVAVFIPGAQRDKTLTHHISGSNTFVFTVGEGLDLAAQRTYPQFFGRSEIIRDLPSNAGKYDLVLEPRIVELRYGPNSPSTTDFARAAMTCAVYDSDARKLCEYPLVSETYIVDRGAWGSKRQGTSEEHYNRLISAVILENIFRGMAMIIEDDSAAEYLFSRISRSSPPSGANLSRLEFKDTLDDIRLVLNRQLRSLNEWRADQAARVGNADFYANLTASVAQAVSQAAIQARSQVTASSPKKQSRSDLVPYRDTAHFYDLSTGRVVPDTSTRQGYIMDRCFKSRREKGIDPCDIESVCGEELWICTHCGDDGGLRSAGGEGVFTTTKDSCTCRSPTGRIRSSIVFKDGCVSYGLTQ
jgi:hypothetical protein